MEIKFTKPELKLVIYALNFTRVKDKLSKDIENELGVIHSRLIDELKHDF